jgi:hypothetical protein
LRIESVVAAIKYQECCGRQDCLIDARNEALRIEGRVIIEI